MPESTPTSADWRAWFATYGARLLLVARQWTRSATDAEDVVQEAFVRYWRQQRELPGDPLPLLITSVRRAALDLIRRSARRERREQVHVDLHAESWFEPNPEGDERANLLEEAVVQLPSEQREVLVLKIWGGLTFAEIAEQLDLSPNTAASRYRYALGGLRSRLSTLEENHG
ncbi:RNA polymerase sigma factor [Actomonas aquatica]|uniref:Sigma-70 family RNA polymerase sigma factor n=1 Tax=Actomonas aquatica TaxID=2866162 RepID=A0ABZ1CDX3_9BACT|nr:sigma-70 family RNA polymerase sigma factor [Opitutus sp. WL0086]WRQ89879.1 sigma-70 family RNA polymerase sigma factor [Opitutus sp. WL0086]